MKINKEQVEKLTSKIKSDIIAELDSRKVRLDNSDIDYLVEKIQPKIKEPKLDNQEILVGLINQIVLSEEQKKLAFNKEKILTPEVRADFITDILNKIDLPEDGKPGAKGEKGKAGKDGKNYKLTDQDRLDIAEEVDLKGVMSEDLFNKRTAQLVKDIQQGKIKLPAHGGASGPDMIAKFNKALGTDDWQNGVPDSGFNWPSLEDTPTTYTGETGNIPVVKQTEDGLEFLDVTADWLEQYLLLLGRTGGQVVIGGTGSGDGLTINSTSNATKGLVTVAGTVYVDEVNNRVGVNTDSPACDFHLLSASGLICQRIESTDANAGIMQLQLLNDSSKELSIGKLGSSVDFFGLGSGAILNRDGNLNIISDSNDPIIFYTDEADTQNLSATEKMRLTSDGDLGVGTKTPAAKLDVVGVSRFGDSSTNYTEIEDDGTLVFKGDATTWDDLRVPVSATEVNGSNPPTDALFKDNGQEIPGDAYSLSFLSTTLGNLTIPDDVVFDTSADFTFEFWLRPVVGSQNNIEFLRKRDVFELDFRGTNQINLDVKGGGGNANSSVQYNRGSWNYIVVQHDLALVETRLYINNILAVTIGASTNDSTRDFEINRSETLFDIDYIAYWDSLLTPTELTGRYNAGSGSQLDGTEVGLKGLWEINDGSGTAVVEKTGIASDGTISGGAEGVEWDWIGGHVGNTSRGSRGVILKYFSPDIENELYFTAQLPHKYKEGSDIFPHVHWIPNAAGSGTNDVRWGLEYTWTNIHELFGVTTVITKSRTVLEETLVKDKHYITDFGAIDGTGKKISSMLICRIFREAENAEDTYTDFAALAEIDIHFEIDTIGSRVEFTK